MEAMDEVKELFRKFKELHKNNAETFDPTFENILRWQYHVNVAEGIEPRNPPAEFRQAEAAREKLFGRSVSDFQELPVYMQDKYRKLQLFFPDRQVYACGSRVNGQYVETWSSDEIRALRKSAGLPDKRESDYDICLKRQKGDNIAKLRERLPEWADLIAVGVPDNEKIPLPMWDFTRLPRAEHANVLALYAAGKWGDLMAIHNDYLLSPDWLCCNSEPARLWFKWGIENGHISGDDEETTATQLDK